MAAKSISETKRVRYLLGLSSPAEREHIESEYFADDDAFQQMLIAEDDLIDAYARDELTGEERQRFEKVFVSSLSGRDRVRFARAFAGTATQSIDTKLPHTFLDIFNILQWARPLRTSTIAALIVFVAVLTWLVIDRRRMTNELRELRAESVELHKRTDALQRSSDNERTRSAEFAANGMDLRTRPDKPKRSELGTTSQRVRNVADVVAETRILSRKFEDLLTLQPGITRDDQAAAARVDGGTVRGTVTDPQGNLVKDAIVTLTNIDNVTRTQLTNEDGVYVFNAIPPGTYSLKVTAPSFKTVSVIDLHALISTSTVQDVQLEVGPVSEIVNVSSAAAELLVNRDDATLGSPFVNKRITQLPLEASKVPGLLTLTRDSVAEFRVTQTNKTLAGVDIDEPLNTYSLLPLNTSNSGETSIDIPTSLTWIRFRLTLATFAIHENYRITIRTAEGRLVTSVDWIEPLRPNQTIIDTPVVMTNELPPHSYVLLLTAKDPDGSFVRIAEYPFEVISHK